MLRQNDYLKAMLLDAAWFWGAPHGYPAIQMVAWCIGNRARDGWGPWHEVLSNLADTCAIDLVQLSERYLARTLPDPHHPNFLAILQSIDHVFNNTATDITGGAHYWADLTNITRPWFQETILGNPRDHVRKAQNGTFVVWL